MTFLQIAEAYGTGVVVASKQGRMHVYIETVRSLSRVSRSHQSLPLRSLVWEVYIIHVIVFCYMCCACVGLVYVHAAVRVSIEVTICGLCDLAADRLCESRVYNPHLLTVTIAIPIDPNPQLSYFPRRTRIVSPQTMPDHPHNASVTLCL